MRVKIFRVIVMEDDPLISWQLEKQLAFLAFDNVHFLESRSQSFRYLEMHNVDLIITNLRLMDGWLTSQELQAMKTHSNHMLITTGFRNDLLQNHPNPKTSFSYLYKPYTFYQLKKFILRL
jgi:two-component SAPR family response regulator